MEEIVRLGTRMFAAERNRDGWDVLESDRDLGFWYMQDSDIAKSFVLLFVFATL